MKESSLPEPLFVDRQGCFKVVLHNSTWKPKTGVIFSSEEKGILDEKNLIAFCRTPRSREEIVKYLALPSSQYALRRYLNPLIQGGVIVMAKPESPRCRNQRYVTNLQN
jgi:ATP-dependent DNA helicase RecG